MAGTSLRQLIIGSLISVLLISTANSMPNMPASTPKDCVILLHGLARSANAMNKLADALSHDYHVINQDYPSRKYPINKLANDTIPKALAQCHSTSSIHFVTHSMGGILVRAYLQQHTIANLKHVVMLGPPNQGSEVVDKLGGLSAFQWLNGPAGSQLGTDSNSVPMQLGKAEFDVGIIAGNRSINVLLSQLISGPNDGKVAVERTKLTGMNDHLVMPVTHPLMMRNNAVIQQVKHYLKHGRFK